MIRSPPGRLECDMSIDRLVSSPHETRCFTRLQREGMEVISSAEKQACHSARHQAIFGPCIQTKRCHLARTTEQPLIHSINPPEERQPRKARISLSLWTNYVLAHKLLLQQGIIALMFATEAMYTRRDRQQGTSLGLMYAERLFATRNAAPIRGLSLLKHVATRIEGDQKKPGSRYQRLGEEGDL